MINSLDEELVVELQNILPVNPDYSDPFDDSSISKISKSRFARNYHFLCKECGEVPKLEFFSKNKIKYKCKTCKESKQLLVREVYNFLYYSEGIEPINKLRCIFHPYKKFIYYCEECNINLCSKCVEECSKNHNKKIISLTLVSDIVNKKDYIKEKIKEKGSFANDEINLNSSNTIHFEYASSSSNILTNEHYLVIKKKDDINNNINNDENREGLINIMNGVNNDELYDEEYYYINLFTIIIYDYENHPNYNHIDTIVNIEKFVLLSQNDYNEIKLKYEFKEENINKDSNVEILGDRFINNNKENCFLVVNELIMKLSNKVNLSEIFDNSYLYKNNSIQLEVRLIERKDKLMNDMSYMFDGITSLDSTSSFSNFNSSNINKMIGMFYNCSSITKLPDISGLNTENVIDMSNMFCNCSSLTQLPDISNWNTINLIDVSHMFKNCESLSSLPDMSKWRIDNVKYMNNMLEDCKSLTSSPSILKWKINKDTNVSDIFKGCYFKELIEKNKSNYKQKNIWTFLEERIFNFPFCLIKTLFDEFRASYYCFIYFSFPIVLIIAHFGILYSSFHLDNSYECTNNQLEYFNLINHTNIRYFYRYIKNFNSTEFSENKENYIIKITNFTKINKDINFEIDQKKIQIINIILGILNPLLYIVFIIIERNIKCINLENKFKISTFIQLFNIISIIFENSNKNIINRFRNSLLIFYNRIEKLFQIKIPDINNFELELMSFSEGMATLSLIYSIVLIIFMTIRCFKIVKEKRYLNNEYKDLFNN